MFGKRINKVVKPDILSSEGCVIIELFKRRRDETLSFKRISLVVMLVIMSMFSMQNTYAKAYFADIPTSHEAYDEVNYLVSLGVIRGYEEKGATYFKPLNTLTRAQAAKMLVLTAGHKPLVVKKSSFTDVKVGEEASGYIEQAVKLGMLSGVTSQKFEPNKAITRDVIAKGLVVAFDLKPDAYKNLEIPFTDVSKSNEYYKYVAALYYNGITIGDGNQYKLTNNLTRVQFARFVARAKEEQYRLSLPVQSAESDVIATIVVNTNGLNIRSTADFTGTVNNVLGKVNKGHIFSVYEETSLYYKVLYNGKYAYVYKPYADKKTQTGGSNTVTPKPVETPKPAEPPATNAQTVGYATVDDLKIRSQANASSSIVSTINRGAKVDVVSLSGQWAKVAYNGKAGYVNKTYLRLKNTSGSALANRIIVIDPGHGGKDPGASGGGVIEKQVVLKVSQKVQQKLQAAGAVVKMTRTGDTFPSLEDRTKFALNNYGEAFISIHVNAAGAASANGAETFYNTISNAQEEAILAKYINDEIVKNANMNNRDVKKADYYVIRNLYMPAVLVELGFVSNSADREKLASEQYLEIYAQSIYNGILKYYEQ